jgi:hypothetical protein
MTHWLCRSRTLLLAALLGLLLASTGCRKEEIRAYTVPKERLRLLAVILPHQNETWVFKLVGPADEVGPQHDAFLQILRSIRFPAEGEPIAWQLPEGWQQEKGDDMRFATILMPDGLDTTVFRFGPEGRQILANVNRWRRQMGLAEIEAADLDQYCKKETIAGESATIIDMEGVRSEDGGMSTRPKPASPSRPTFTAPGGWSTTAPGMMAFAAFEVGEGSDKAGITVSQAGGSPIDNINRWRGQVGLPSASDDLIKAESKSIDVAGEKCLYVDLSNQEANKRILGVIYPQGDRSWFFKMTGPPELVEKQKPAFEAFVRSVRFAN